MHYPVVTGFLILHLARYGHSGPAAFSAYAGLILVSRFFLGGLPDRIHPAITYYLGLAAMAIALSGIALGPGPGAAVALTGLLGFRILVPLVGGSVGGDEEDSQQRARFGDRRPQRILRPVCRAEFVCPRTMASRFGYSSAFWMAAALGAAAVVGYFVFAGRVSPEALPLELNGGVELVSEGIDVG